MAVKLTKSAEADLAHVYIEGFLQFGEAQSDRYQIGLADAFERLGRYPLAARAAPELGPDIRVSPYQSHVIVYRANGREVLILRVRSAREDWQSDES